MKRRDTGARGEQLAAEFLKKKKFRLVESNYRCPHGEIDLIVRRKDLLVFVEVRTKSGPRFGSPEESVTAAKREHLRATAWHYIQTHDDLPREWRIDFVAVEVGADGQASRIEHYENAVGEE